MPLKTKSIVNVDMFDGLCPTPHGDKILEPGAKKEGNLKSGGAKHLENKDGNEEDARGDRSVKECTTFTHRV